MTPIEEYFRHIIVINLARRTDRWAHVLEQMKALGITDYERFDAYDKPFNRSGRPDGSFGGNASHRAVLEIISWNKWPRCLVLEDDFSIAHTSPAMTGLIDAQRRFAEMINDVPQDWDLLYLGGHYGEDPMYRVGPHVIRCGRMHTLSSYGVTCSMARRVAPYFNDEVQADSKMALFNRANRCFIFQPRLFVQCPGKSDISNEESENEHCMLDTRHEEMLIDGVLVALDDGLFSVKTTINKREIACETDLDGQTVIVGETHYTVVRINLRPATPSASLGGRLRASPRVWYRGENIEYILKAK